MIKHVFAVAALVTMLGASAAWAGDATKVDPGVGAPIVCPRCN